MMDVLSDLLRVAGATPAIGKTLGGTSADSSATKFEEAHSTTAVGIYALAKGRARITLESHRSRQSNMELGDVFIVCPGVRHRLEWFDEHSRVLTGTLEFSTGILGISTLNLPDAMTLSTASNAVAGALVQRWYDEREREDIGWEMVCLGFIHALFVEALRLDGGVSQTHGSGMGWLRGIADSEIGSALKLMHERPEHRWTVAELADRLAISRSAFAVRFKTITGRPPLEYLTWWRLQRAAARLKSGDGALAEVASLSGYQSEAAFGKAFRREFGVSPGQWRRQAIMHRHTPSRLQVELKKRHPFEHAEQEAGLNLIKTNEAFQRPFSELMKKFGLVGPDYNVLRILRGTGHAISKTELIQQLLTPLEDIQSVLLKLARRGWIAICEPPIQVEITSSGIALLAQMDEPIVSIHRKQLAHFSQGELAEFNRLLVKARNPAG